MEETYNFRGSFRCLILDEKQKKKVFWLWKKVWRTFENMSKIQIKQPIKEPITFPAIISRSKEVLETIKRFVQKPQSWWITCTSSCTNAWPDEKLLPAKDFSNPNKGHRLYRAVRQLNYFIISLAKKSRSEAAKISRRS